MADVDARVDATAHRSEMRSKDDRVTIHPAGADFQFKAPRDGYVSYGINEPEDMLYDNQWYQSGGLIDHTTVTLSPVE